MLVGSSALRRVMTVLRIGLGLGLGARCTTNQRKNGFHIYIYIYMYIYTGCPRRNVPDFGRTFLMLKYTPITQNTYVQS